MRQDISFFLNGAEVNVKVEDHWRLIDCLRDEIHLTGTKEGCGEGECGACTVLIDGKAVNSCLYPVLEAEGKSIVTIEGLQSPENRLSPIQQAFVDKGAIQCGFCTPGMILAAKALLDSNTNPSDSEIREALRGNLCRCTGYVQIIEAIRQMAIQIRDAE
ncbi:MAG: (2Fe-2S)-binding protein [Candidatus Aminicenantes bacterium]|jgi:carbon-monoxide dehydrogenase small subunit